MDRRTLQIETGCEVAPVLEEAHWVSSEAGRHTYQFDAAHTGVAILLAQATGSGSVLDVETHRAPINEVIADIYERWQREKSVAHG